VVENPKGRKMKVLRFDNGGEHTSIEFKAYLAGEDIKHQQSIPGRPDHNGVAECINQTLTKRARSTRLQADMSEGFWAETVSHACYLVDMSLPIADDFQILEEIWREESVGYSTL